MFDPRRESSSSQKSPFLPLAVATFGLTLAACSGPSSEVASEVPTGGEPEVEQPKVLQARIHTAHVMEVKTAGGTNYLALQAHNPWGSDERHSFFYVTIPIKADATNWLSQLKTGDSFRAAWSIDEERNVRFLPERSEQIPEETQKLMREEEQEEWNKPFRRKPAREVLI